ncbi:hypothetical protein B0H16DRAFT_1483760 [Mycena metata]|uniref:Uncharacterized protein n=1 Tax=Mycena metata TaxID=1033252 RepID=A0AAD7DWM6_9AGAR|nr:hypothetical protein B0H16DRAFT_1483760 [Mycena metata]
MCLLREVAPALIHTWSNTINHLFVKEVVCKVVANSDIDECCTFFTGVTHDPTPFIRQSWCSLDVQTSTEEYMRELGRPVIYHYSFHRSLMVIKISNLHLGGVKHGPQFATIIRIIFFLIFGGVVQPATAIIEADLLQNGPLDCTDTGSAALEIRLSATAMQDNAQVSTSCPGEGDSSSSSSSGGAAANNKLSKPTHAHSYSNLAVTSQEARATQLERLVADAEMRLRLGCDEDGKNLSHAARPWGRSAEVNKAQLTDQAKIGLWNTAQAEARRVVSEDGLTPQMRAEQTRRGQLIMAFVWSFEDPHNIVIGTSKNSTHLCAETGEEVKVTEAEFPSLVRPFCVHDILNDPALVDLLPGTVDEVFPHLVANTTGNPAGTPPHGLLTVQPISVHDARVSARIVGSGRGSVKDAGYRHFADRAITVPA